MRKVLQWIGFSLVMGTGIMPSSGEAREYPWCAQYSAFTYNCGFMTLQQCRASIYGVGGYCRQNWSYAPQQARKKVKRKVR